MATLTRIETGTSKALSYEITGITGADTSQVLNADKYRDVSVQIDGTIGSPAATWTVQVSNDARGNPEHADHASAVWKTASDTTETSVTGNTIPVDIIQILVSFSWIRVITTGGTGTTLNARIKIAK